MRRLFVAGGLSLALTSAAFASPAMTTVATQMRATPNSHAAIVQSIPANAEIDVTGCGKVWCSASWRDIGGFVRASAISAGPDTPPLVNEEPPPPPPPVVVFAPPLVIAPFGCCWGGYSWHHGW